ncbi:peptidase [Niallia circulans]|uniref:Peptidase n=1 Tax=Niallia circulans TaxID=1397 RepID=A0A553STH7_NIACI|nr:DUF1796 family putative cysteine peptidase [Niallia circulans]TRZ40292.1 peptidase [Niallia circulans]
MKLDEIKGSYNAIFSLGENCIPALKLRKYNLRQMAGPFDWVGTPKLKNVNALINTNFADFLNESNLVIPQYASTEDVLVVDSVNYVSFNHDFKTDVNTLTDLPSLPQVQEKYSNRINRFMTTLTTSQRLLFIRTNASITDIVELERILSQKGKNEFSILVVNHTSVKELIEVDWNISNVCSIELPNEEIWEGNNDWWEFIFQEISLY